jgi:hypothetical protein
LLTNFDLDVTYLRVEKELTDKYFIKFIKKVFQKYNRPFFISSSPCQRQRELFPSLGVRRPLAFHILIFSISQSSVFFPIHQTTHFPS